MSLAVWITFFAAAWAISLSPGAAAVAAMGSGLQHGGARGSLPLIAGLVLGLWTQVAVVGIGLGAVIAASATAFHVVQWAGVAYLCWLGVQQWRAPAHALVAAAGEAPGLAPAALARRLFWRGYAVNALNPKGTVFLLAVLPQFLNLAAPLPMQYLVAGATLGLTEGCVMAGYAALALRVLRRLRTERQVRWVQRTFGTLFIAAGAALAAVRR
ncbi:LysE family transporter [Xylophilus ampelinus]|uniref:Homoserine/homoserine lactone efflux protein n=1 Tax=Xylophilus ampelinus TaxID=54067 RepID=A0A318SSM1_9BURK|nr:LysE family transporter [Xylophilus ampelinus]MCS4510628.1 LysE family transporter [Xylophilus ampelinus]PYE76319.1 homoserine/homoserine lactone efflux protein [Xylophilus ampelinus]